RHLQIRERDASMHAIDQIEQKTETFAKAAHDPQRQRPDRQLHRFHDQILEPVPHAARDSASRSRSQTWKAGSMDSSSRTSRMFSEDRLGIRTASFEV